MMALRLVATAALASMLLPAFSEADDPPKDKPPILEFRILAPPDRDPEAVAAAKAEPMTKPPKGFRWVILGVSLKGESPAFGDKTLTDAKAEWEEASLAGSAVECRGKNLKGGELVRSFLINGNTPDTLRLDDSPKHYFREIRSYEILAGPDRLPMDRIVTRDERAGPGAVRRWVLVKIDPQGVTEKDLKSAYESRNDILEPCIAIQFSAEGAKRFRELTRAHQPEEDGAFLYNMGILIEGKIVAAPTLRTEIGDAAIIEGIAPAEVKRVIKRLKDSIERAR